MASLDLLTPHLSKIKIPNAQQLIYKDECVYSFDNPESETGLYVSLVSFLGFGRNYVEQYFQKTGNAVFLHIQREKKPVPEPEKTGDGPEKKITRLAIGVEGGFDPDSGRQKFTYTDHYAVVVLPGFHTYPWPNPALPDVGSTINVEDMPNTFKNYYFDAYSNEELDDRLTIVESELSKPLKRANSNTNINKFFDDSKTKKQKKALASSVGHAREGGMSYVSTNVNATATHLIKLEVYDLKKLAKVPENKQWKHADVRIKFYTKTSNRIYEHSKQLIYNITKEVAESQDCKKYFFNDEA